MYFAGQVLQASVRELLTDEQKRRKLHPYDVISGAARAVLLRRARGEGSVLDVVRVELAGGAISAFHLADVPRNPRFIERVLRPRDCGITDTGGCRFESDGCL